ncbi:MAG: glycerophosphodiester phosphodiesterase [Tepidibacter sp.]|uniref:glycerophosphodiester phosphodiesterase n=1 Tax=Tepidibacter sp. TaxID=2529387 RepID=UPI0025ED1C27|nr:glycerophosphodiester phosphodiesterase [Tepidibacter sp.]MCT4509771.1 glycerophosphodiester phosphodiesterase [Tepidibacter sp.]
MIKNFAHRGFSGKYPENTMLAFEKAIEIGADGVELDVQLTKDEQVVIIHDETVNRTTGGEGRVQDYTYEELSKLDASYIYTGKYGINKIPTLREYCEFVKDKDIVTNIELKTGIFEYLGIEEKVWDLIKEYKLEEKVIISSFNHFSILRMKKIAPNLKYGLLSETWLIDAGKYTHNMGVQCYHPLFRNLTNEVVKEIKQYGIEINTYTVNTEEDVRNLINKGIDIVIGNFPDMVNKVRQA